MWKCLSYVVCCRPVLKDAKFYVASGMQRWILVRWDVTLCHWASGSSVSGSRGVFILQMLKLTTACTELL